MIIAMEEAGELVQAIAKCLRHDKPESTDHLTEEVVDVEIMIAQLKYMISKRDPAAYAKWRKIKLQRFKGRLEKDGLLGEE